LLSLQNIGVILGIQVVVQGLIVVALWMLVFHRMRLGGAWYFVAMLPLIGVIISPLVMSVSYFIVSPTANATLLFTIVPNLISFVFAVLPLLILAIKLGSLQDEDVFK